MTQQHIGMLVLTMALCLQGVAAERKLNVVATTADFGAIAREIGDERIDVTVLARPGEDVHFVAPKPSHIAKLSKADVLIEGGAELEIGWLPPLIEGARNTKIAAGQPGHVACAEGLTLLEVPVDLDRAQGDIHAMGNPHYMTDPLRARQVAGKIANTFAQVDPQHAAMYGDRLKTFEKRLDEKLGDWKKQLDPFRGRRVVAFHNSWPYFADRFGLKIDVFLEPKPGIPPSPAHLVDVVTTMKTEKINVILVEPYQNRRTAEKVATPTGAGLVDFTQYPGGVPGTDAGYIDMMDYLVSRLVAALGNGNGGKEPQE